MVRATTARSLGAAAGAGEQNQSDPVDSLRLEVCVDSVASLIAAVSAGAHRIELCAALAVAGLTPSPGLMERAGGCGAPVYAMIRPRPGDFEYSADDLDLMLRDIDASRRAGLDGLVLGVSRPNGELDDTALRRLLDHADGLPCTLHRAFDATPELDVALETAIDLGFERILTSGGAPSAWEGRDRIADLVAQAGARISIMAGAGVTTHNAVDLVRRTGVREVHASCSAKTQGASDQSLQRLSAYLGIDQSHSKETQAERVSDLLSALSGINPAHGINPHGESS
jgi:copper homeostasis protein